TDHLVAKLIALVDTQLAADEPSKLAHGLRSPSVCPLLMVEQLKRVGRNEIFH
ncbi:MAG: hypothetical protein Q9180_008449, partial [Flavoplaca navasiana]